MKHTGVGQIKTSFHNNGSFVSRDGVTELSPERASGDASRTSGVGGNKSEGPFMWKIQSISFNLSSVSADSPAASAFLNKSLTPF